MSGSKQINSNRHLGPEYQPKLSREFFSKVGSVFFYIYIFPFSCTLLLLASGQTYSAKSKKTMRKPLHIYNISELTRDRGISNLDSGWQDEKKKGDKMCAWEGGLQSKDAAEEYPALKNNSPWDGDEEKRGGNPEKVHILRLGSGSWIRGVGPSVPGWCF